MAGLELLWNSVKSDFVSKNDALITIVHSLLLQQNYKCLGVGERFSEADDKLNGSEMLPKNWNQDQMAYVLRYKKPAVGSEPAKKLLVKAVGNNGSLLLSFLEVPGDATADLTLQADKFLTKEYRNYEKAFINDDSLNEIQKSFLNDVINKLKTPSSPKSAPTSNSNSQSRQNRPPEAERRVPPPMMPSYGGSGYDFDADLRNPYPSIGGRDLDPLGHGVGGMILDPRDLHRGGGGGRPGFGPAYPGGNFTPGGRPLPPGAVPPGARFDPFGPPGAGPRPNRHRGPRPDGPPGSGFAAPDPDHERPPDDYDDMFM
ncbi:Proteasome inhibitor PI31 subunit [Halotydeus destructor]|nr:Proteasome inhibitor PI31 subunit [Halotydeus destructor]